jgi:NAD(P)-dependent dehydrogenase (short-subunit alcohol dehydrogenase family)
LPNPYRVVVVGGTGGIGAAITKEFIALGATVTATAATEKELQNADFGALEGLSLAALDVTDDKAVNQFAGEIGNINALVNCAGILRRDEEFDLEIFQKVIDVNLTGTMRCCTAFRGALARSKGSIVNIASMNAFAALPRLPAYCASKGGIVMLTRALAHAWAGEGIRVNAVAPGYIETPINAEGRKDKEHYDKIAGRTALKRWGQPEDVAATVAYLCMPAANYVTGSVAMVDGGFLAG